MNEEKTEKEKDCSTCIFSLTEYECLIPFEVLGQLSSAGYFYCPFWVGMNEK